MAIPAGDKNVDLNDIVVVGVDGTQTQFLKIVPNAKPQNTGNSLPICRMSTNSAGKELSRVADLNGDNTITRKELYLWWVVKTASLTLGKTISPDDIFVARGEGVFVSASASNGFVLEHSSNYGLRYAFRWLDPHGVIVDTIERLCEQRESDEPRTSNESSSGTSQTSSSSSGGSGPPEAPGGGV